MNEQPPRPEREKVGTVARIIHGAIAGGLALVFAVFLYLRSQAVIEFPAERARGLRLAAYLVLGAAILAAQLLRGRITQPRHGADLSDWWTGSLPKAVVIWAVAEAGGLTSIVLGWLIADTSLLALGVAVGLALLFVSRPSRLESSH
ncbi:MAG: hypothetical protein JSV86_19515 [Gemmatimonadota bacterium]|nr:MAG: hypothetical protein JSV86_19515 [Gemmatimonadota bacterium]